MADNVDLGRSTRFQIGVSPANIEAIEKHMACPRSYVRVEAHVPLDSVIRRSESLNVSRHARRALRGVASLSDDPTDQYELWQFAKFTLQILEQDGWQFGIGESADGETLAVVLTPARQVPGQLTVETPEPGETRETECIRDYFGGQRALQEFRNVVRKAQTE